MCSARHISVGVSSIFNSKDSRDSKYYLSGFKFSENFLKQLSFPLIPTVN